MSVNATSNIGAEIELRATDFYAGTVLSGGDPRVVIVLVFGDGKYEGHLELTPENANVFGEELRKAAEAATTEEG